MKYQKRDLPVDYSLAPPQRCVQCLAEAVYLVKEMDPDRFTDEEPWCEMCWDEYEADVRAGELK